MNAPVFCVQNLKLVALPFHDVIASLQKIWARYLFSKIFTGLLFGWTLWMYWPNLKSVALTVPEIIVIAAFGFLEAVEGRYGTIQKSVGDFL